MGHYCLNITQSNSRLSFTVRMGTDRPWWRYLDIDGQPLYCIGNLCDTCPSIFGLVEYTHLPLTPVELAGQLRAGLTGVSPAILDTVAGVLPKGNYVVGLLEIHPVYHPSKDLPDGRKTNYNWTEMGIQYTGDTLIESILPLVGHAELNPATIKGYKAMLKHDIQPTALAFSVVDTRCISGSFWEWHLAHFLLDGHHKVMAASQVEKPITLLSFLNIDESSSRKDWIDKTIQQRYGEPV
jgi:hypothetical protein